MARLKTVKAGPVHKAWGFFDARIVMVADQNERYFSTCLEVVPHDKRMKSFRYSWNHGMTLKQAERNFNRRDGNLLRRSRDKATREAMGASNAA